MREVVATRKQHDLLRMRIVRIIAMSLALIAPPALTAGDLAPPSGEVLLIVDGAISNTNVDNAAHLDLAALQSLPRHEFSSRNPWQEGVQHFAGVRLSDLLEFLGAESSEFLAYGFDDYKAEFEGVDVERYPVLLAWEHNGELISLRELGPLRIMFPFDDYPELQTNLSEAMSVWQLVRMTVH